MRRAERATLGVLVIAGLAGCQVVFGYESFEGRAANDAGAEGDSASDAGAPTHRCDVLDHQKVADGGRGPILSRVNLPGGGCVWMDLTEVTVDQYGQWLTALDGGAPAWVNLLGATTCDWKDAGAPPSNPAGSPTDVCAQMIPVDQKLAFDGNKPIRCVDWCDARAFCYWAGKRLCFDHDGTNVLVPGFKPTEWTSACSGGLARAYPYGTSFDAAACNADQSLKCAPAAGGGICGPTPVEERPACRASPNGPVDLSGNVGEWIDLCFDDPGVDAGCHVRGGDYRGPPDRASCNAIEPTARGERRPWTGFRCCAPLTPEEETMLSK